MLYLILFGLFVTAKTQDLQTVKYSFDIDFYKHFNSKRCDGESEWQLVKYNDLDIESHGSDHGIQCIRKSCASSFPISFSSGHLEVIFYTEAVSQKFSVSVEVFDEADNSISNYCYSPQNQYFKPGWQTITVEINKQAKGYVKFRGSTLSNEIVVIDSFRYVPNITKIADLKKVKRSVIFVNEDVGENINNATTPGPDEKAKLGSSIGNADSQSEDEFIKSSAITAFGRILDRETESTNDNIKESQPNNNSFWNPITIFLVTLGIVLVVAITALSSYYCGKIRAMDQLPSLSIEDIEPPLTISIPRVTRTQSYI